MAVWLHFMIAITAWAIDENSIKPDEDRSVFNGNILTAAGGHSFLLKISTSWSSERLGGVLKKCRIYGEGKETRCSWVSSTDFSLFFFQRWSIIQTKSEVKGFARICLLPLCYQILFMYSLYSVAGYGFCMLVPVIEIDCSSSQCIPWSWDCCLEDCRDLSLPIESSALKNCIWMKRIFNFNDYFTLIQQRILRWSVAVSWNLRNLQFPSRSNRNVVQVLDASLHRYRLTHLYHSCSFFGFQKFNTCHIACVFVNEHNMKIS